MEERERGSEGGRLFGGEKRDDEDGVDGDNDDG